MTDAVKQFKSKITPAEVSAFARELVRGFVAFERSEAEKRKGKK